MSQKCSFPPACLHHSHVPFSCIIDTHILGQSALLYCIVPVSLGYLRALSRCVMCTHIFRLPACISLQYLSCTSGVLVCMTLLHPSLSSIETICLCLSAEFAPHTWTVCFSSYILTEACTCMQTVTEASGGKSEDF